MVEGRDFRVRSEVADDVESLAERLSIEPDRAAELLLLYGSFVINNLEDGGEFLLLADEELQKVEWNLPKQNPDPQPPKPPVLRVV